MTDKRLCFPPFSSQVTETPWCDDGIAPETSVLADKLVKYNALGVLTINSQPRVNGVPSTHPIHGWGDQGGFVFQKVSRFLFVFDKCCEMQCFFSFNILIVTEAVCVNGTSELLYALIEVGQKAEIPNLGSRHP